MPDSILRAKLHRPGPTTDLVCRPRLLARLDEGLAGPLTLVAAPAGYGKTTLVSQWLEGRPEKSAWLSLDENDADLLSFLRHFTAAIRTACPTACSETQVLLESPICPPIAVIARSLANELNETDQRLIVVLDDYHALRSTEVHKLIGDLLRHPPQCLRLILATRRDPPLNLTALRARNRLTELRAVDLQFTPEEVESFFVLTLGGVIPAHILADTGRRLEGWAVGLRLTALAACRHKEPAEFLMQLGGGLHEIREYLVQEVIRHQPGAVQDWLRKVSILDRIRAPLCEAVCADADDPALTGEAFVRKLERSSLFAIACDPTRTWYRFHAEFRGLLLRQLVAEIGQEGLASLHSRATAWFAQAGLIEEAVRHAVAAGDLETAVRLVDESRVKVLESGRWDRLVEPLMLLPEELRNSRPELLIAQLWVLVVKSNHGEFARVLNALEAALQECPLPANHQAELSFFRGHTCFFRREDSRSRGLFAQALKDIPESYHVMRGVVEIYHALAVQKDGGWRQCVRRLRDALQATDPRLVRFQCRMRLALSLVFLLEAELSESAREAGRVRSSATEIDDLRFQFWGRYVEALTHFMHNEFEDAIRLLEPVLTRPHLFHGRAALDSFAIAALSMQALGYPDRARQSVAAMERFASELGFPAYFSISRSLEARLALMQGDTVQAGRLIRHADIRDQGTLMLFWAEEPRITACRVNLAGGASADAEAVLHTLQRYARENRSVHNRLRLLEVLPLQASAYLRIGDERGALAALQEAVEMARPGGIVRPFIEAGPQIVGLLRRLGRDMEDPQFVRDLMATCEPGQAAAAGAAVPGGAAADPRELTVAALAPLTEREQEVLRLLAQRLQTAEIADHLFVAPSTVNSHLKSIYSKLGVRSRREAIVKVQAAHRGHHRAQA